MQKPTQDARLWLTQEFERRRSRNPSYSLRAFARQLQVPPGRLSELLSGKRPVNARLGARLAERLGLDPKARAVFLAQTARRGPSGEAADAVAPEYRALSLDAFQAIADWHHFAILSLVEVEGFRSDPRWIARRLGISPIVARAAVERLLRLQLLDKRDGRLVLTDVNITTSHDVSSAAIRKRHRQTLEHALEALETVPVDERDITSMSMAIDPARLPEAKQMIRAFRRKLCAFLEGGAHRTEVYDLNIQLIPITKKEKRK